LTHYGKALEHHAGTAPTPKGAEVLLKVSHCGLCHSDLHLIDGYLQGGDRQLDLRGNRQLPFTLGHEICGTIAELGADAGFVHKSGLFAVYPWIGCGSCDRCQRGEEQLCDKSQHLGIDRDGGFASHVLVPHFRYLIDADGLDASVAGSYMCCGLTAFSALRKAMAAGGDGPLLLVGLGGVGLMALLLARTMTDKPVAVADINDFKRRLAVVHGAAGSIDPSLPDARREVRSRFGAMAAAIDFVGSEQTVEFAQSTLGKGGSVVVVGLMGGRLCLPVPIFPLRQLSIIGSFVGSLPEAKELMALAKEGQPSTFPVSVRDLENGNAAIDELRTGNVIGRIALKP
jgi:D-arabinose 1-dehydrogenase-like Zn-dependent alcohol dehydrogenase